MQIFIINLSSATDRRISAAKQLSNAGLTYKFFDALTGNQSWQPYFQSYDEQQYLINTGRTVTSGEIGCYASHRALWQKCVDLNQPIMIMEDDFLLKENFRAAFHETEKLIARYGYIRLQNERKGKRKLVKSSGSFNLVYYTKMPHSLMCYALSPDIAKQFIENSIHLTAPVDVMIKKIWDHKQRLYGLLPYPVVEHELSIETLIPGRIKPKKSLKIKFLRFYTKITWVIKRIIFTITFNPSN